jgi:hypothetical protein
LINPQIELKITVVLLEEDLYENTEFTDNQKIIYRTFPELDLTVEQV